MHIFICIAEYIQKGILSRKAILANVRVYVER